MWLRSVLALSVLAALAGAAGLAARLLLPAAVTALPWSMPLEHFGGWSGIDTGPDGREFVAISDRGSIAFGSLERENGRLSGISVRTIGPIGSDMGPWSTSFAQDTEGVSLQADGALVISHEGFARILRHHAPAPPERILQPLAFQQMLANRSLEAVAVTPEGLILTLPEIPDDARSYPVFTHDGERWDQPFSLARDGWWRAVGADIGPDGRLYLLERQFLWIGFNTRIRRFDLSAPERPLRGETLYHSPLWRHGNLEGMGIWQDSSGRMRAIMVSDDNFLPFLPTEIVEVLLPE